MAYDLDKARERARALIVEHNVTAAPVPIERIARSLGIKVQYAPFDAELSGMAFIKDGTPVIGINALHSPSRQRFTLAHELAHILLHREQLEDAVHVDKGSLRRDALAAEGTDPVEIEANSFAAELLMPGSILEAVLAGHVVDLEDDEAVEAFARRFRVSPTAFHYRLRNS